MLQRTEQARGLPYDNGVAPRHFDLVDLYAFLKSNRRVLAGWVVVALTVALVYAFTATPLYTATADLTINSKKFSCLKITSKWSATTQWTLPRWRVKSRCWARRVLRMP